MNDENEDEIVLVVDDSPDTVSMLNDALDNEGLSVLFLIIFTILKIFFLCFNKLISKITSIK